MRVRILRQKDAASEQYWETFQYDGPEDNSVAGLLDYINYRDDITDENGKPTTRILWECACLQGICGACAMVINGVPALACETFIKDIKGDLEIRPLRKFPVVRDLITDRSSIQENLMQTNVYIEKFHPSSDTDHDHQYAVAKCLKCGLCLEVCPNYTNGKNFFGATFANDCYLVASRNRQKTKDIQKTYKQHFGKFCSKALSCMEVCPAQVPTLSSIAKLNR